MPTPKTESANLRKKKFYLFCTVLLCLLLILVLYMVAETWYINYALVHKYALGNISYFKLAWVLASI